MSARVPVFTNFPDKKRLSAKDSLLLHDIKKTAWFILNDPFWMGQVEQIDITDCGFKCWSFEMVPTVGNHFVKLGSGDDIERKFQRLFVFYKQVMSRTGFNKYNFVDVQFAGQVIGSKTKINKVDSIQLRKNVDKLLKEAQEIQNTIQTNSIEKPQTNPEQQAAPQTPVSEPLKTDPNPVKPEPTPVKTEEKKSNTEPKPIKKPKAVMPKGN
jgi:cell division protein FtsQ